MECILIKQHTSAFKGEYRLLLRTVRFVPRVRNCSKRILVVIKRSKVSLLVSTSFCLIRFFFLGYITKSTSLGFFQVLFSCYWDSLVFSSIYIIIPDIFLHLSPRTFPISKNAIPGLSFFVFCIKQPKEKQKEIQVCCNDIVIRYETTMSLSYVPPVQLEKRI